MSIQPLQREAPHPLAPLDRPTGEQANRSLPLAAWGIAIIEAILGYEWLISSLNKLTSPDYVRDFSPMLQQMALPGNPNGWWVALVSHLVVPAAAQWAKNIAVGELGVAFGYFAGAVLWASGQFPKAPWTRWLNGGVLVALMVGVFLTLNYDWMAGAPFPWVNPTDPFDEGVTLDSILTGIGVSLLLLHLLTWWTAHRSQTSREKRSQR